MNLKPHKVIIINLETRPDRWGEMCFEMDKMDFGLYSRFSAHEGGLEGYNRSYYDCMQAEGSILVLEDDAMFIDGGREILDEAMRQLPEDFDMLYLGGNVLEPIQRYSANLYRAYRGVHCTHAILWSDVGRQRFLQYYPHEKRAGQLVDNWLFERGQALMNCYVISPLIAWQRPGYSDVSGCHSDYVEEMRKHEKENML